MTRIRSMMMAIAALCVLAFGAAAPGVANATEPTTPPPSTCTAGTICGVPVTTYVVASEIAGTTLGQSFGEAATSGLAGNVGDTGSYAKGTSMQSLQTNIWGSANGCASNCGSVGGSFEGFGKNVQEAGAFATDKGPKASSAAAASGVQGASSLMGRLRIGVSN